MHWESIVKQAVVQKLLLPLLAPRILTGIKNNLGKWLQTAQHASNASVFWQLPILAWLFLASMVLNKGAGVSIPLALSHRSYMQCDFCVQTDRQAEPMSSYFTHYKENRKMGCGHC